MDEMPSPRGPISELLFERWRDSPGRARAPQPACQSPGPLADEDLQLALYCCYELHYGGLPGVDERWEWNPWLLELCAEMEASFERGLLDELGAPSDSAGPEEMDLALRAIAEADDAPSPSRWVEHGANVDQMTEFMVHRSAYQLKEADPHSWALPRLSGPPKAALVEIQADEYGGGRPERIHATMFARSMEALGLDSSPGAYLDSIPATTLATVNLMSMLGLHRRWRGAIVGHLALFEMTSSIPNRRYSAALRRLGFGQQATAFFDEHVEADAVHENIAAVDLAGGLVRQDPTLGRPFCGAPGLSSRSTGGGRGTCSTPGSSGAARCARPSANSSANWSPARWAPGNETACECRRTVAGYATCRTDTARSCVGPPRSPARACPPDVPGLAR